MYEALLTLNPFNAEDAIEDAERDRKLSGAASEKALGPATTSLHQRLQQRKLRKLTVASTATSSTVASRTSTVDPRGSTPTSPSSRPSSNTLRGVEASNRGCTVATYRFTPSARLHRRGTLQRPSDAASPAAPGAGASDSGAAAEPPVRRPSTESTPSATLAQKRRDQRRQVRAKSGVSFASAAEDRSPLRKAGGDPEPNEEEGTSYFGMLTGGMLTDNILTGAGDLIAGAADVDMGMLTGHIAAWNPFGDDDSGQSEWHCAWGSDDDEEKLKARHREWEAARQDQHAASQGPRRAEWRQNRKIERKRRAKPSEASKAEGGGARGSHKASLSAARTSGAGAEGGVGKPKGSISGSGRARSPTGAGGGSGSRPSAAGAARPRPSSGGGNPGASPLTTDGGIKVDGSPGALGNAGPAPTRSRPSGAGAGASAASPAPRGSTASGHSQSSSSGLVTARLAAQSKMLAVRAALWRGGAQAAEAPGKPAAAAPRPSQLSRSSSSTLATSPQQQQAVSPQSRPSGSRLSGLLSKPLFGRSRGPALE